MAALRSRVIVWGEIGVKPGVVREATAEGPSCGRVLSEVHAAVSMALAATSSAFARSRSIRRQCRTMPIWPSENETNTPMMYSWISVVRLAWKMIRMTIAARPRMIMPFENTSRSPRVLRAFGA